jgi:DNA polymerase-3 subunit delta'
MSAPSALAGAVDRFARALANGRVAHAYLVVGAPRGEGAAYARECLALLFCEAARKPCRACPGCRQVEGLTHPDVVWIEPRKKSRTVGIGEVRELQRRVYQTAYAGGWKACVLANADRLGEEAANAFLKTLEEPPPRCLFLLLTDNPQAVLPTVASRCQRVVLTTEQDALPEAWRAGVEEWLAAQADAGGGLAITLAPRLLALLGTMREALEAEEKEAAEGEGDLEKETIEARVEARFRELRTLVLRQIELWHRDVLVRVCGGDAALLHFPSLQESVDRVAATLTCPQALRNIRLVEELSRRLDRNLPQEAAFAWALEGLTLKGRGV